MIVLRPAVAQDAEFLTDMLVEAINWRPGRHFSRERVMSDPESVHYVAGWPAPGDVGTLAESAGVPIGAAWMRLLPVDDPGYGFVAADIPELSLAVVAGWRRRGVGRQLLRAVVAQARCAGWTGVSLSVERDNPAQDLYQAEGFRTVRSERDSDTMLMTFAMDGRAGDWPTPTSHSDDSHQQYLQRNKNGYCPDNGTGVSCPVGLFSKPQS